jgi:biopolymer transport protein ExbD
MAMNATSVRDGEPLSEINTTPLIDVMLVLLIMLIVTLDPPALAVKLDTPVPRMDQPPPPVKPEVVTIAVDFNGGFTWNGVPVSAEELEARFRSEATRDPQPEIHIQPHRLAKYGAVAHVMSSAQRNHLTRLGVIGGT